MSSWPKRSAVSFRDLARLDPGYLMRWVQSDELDSSDLSFALEALGFCGDHPGIRDIILPFLTHRSRVVREGAVYGLEGQPPSDEVRHRLEQVAEHDPSPGVREAATDALEDYAPPRGTEDGDG